MKKWYKKLPYLVLLVAAGLLIWLWAFGCDQNDLYMGMCGLGLILMSVITGFWVVNYGILLLITRRVQHPVIRTAICIFGALIACGIELGLWFLIMRMKNGF